MSLARGRWPLKSLYVHVCELLSVTWCECVYLLLKAERAPTRTSGSVCTEGQDLRMCLRALHALGSIQCIRTSPALQRVAGCSFPSPTDIGSFTCPAPTDCNSTPSFIPFRAPSPSGLMSPSRLPGSRDWENGSNASSPASVPEYTGKWDFRWPVLGPPFPSSSLLTTLPL